MKRVRDVKGCNVIDELRSGNRVIAFDKLGNKIFDLQKCSVRLLFDIIRKSEEINCIAFYVIYEVGEDENV